MKQGKLFVVGVGPGDPELITLKAVRILRDVPAICVPKGKEEGTSLALSILRPVVPLDGKDVFEAHFPMRKTKDPDHGSELGRKWDAITDAIMGRLNTGTDVAFITLGDPSVYSTFFYLYDRLLMADPPPSVEIIPGVSSVNAAACRLGLSLGLADEKIAVIPATYAKDLSAILGIFDTVVLMKVHRVFGTILKTLEGLNLAGNAHYIARVGMDDEIVHHDVRNIPEEHLNYFSVLIVRK